MLSGSEEWTHEFLSDKRKGPYHSRTNSSIDVLTVKDEGRLVGTGKDA